MLKGPANAPAVLLPVVLALTLIVGLAVTGRWVTLAFVVGFVIAGEIWRRIKPARRAGRVERSWPWHDQ